MVNPFERFPRIEMGTSIRVEDLIRDISGELDDELLVEFIKRIDEYQANWEFTKKCAAYFNSELERLAIEEAEELRLDQEDLVHNCDEDDDTGEITPDLINEIYGDDDNLTDYMNSSNYDENGYPK